MTNNTNNTDRLSEQASEQSPEQVLIGEINRWADFMDDNPRYVQRLYERSSMHGDVYLYDGVVEVLGLIPQEPDYRTQRLQLVRYPNGHGYKDKLEKTLDRKLPTFLEIVDANGVADELSINPDESVNSKVRSHATGSRAGSSATNLERAEAHQLSDLAELLSSASVAPKRWKASGFVRKLGLVKSQ